MDEVVFVKNLNVRFRVQSFRKFQFWTLICREKGGGWEEI
jgi:hypothetical protein